jgi:light-regulated signal transduction histidine kinase (bacteriophytochrome)
MIKEWINFRVTDTRIGIEKDKFKTLFNSFTQSSSSTTRLYGGSGLGLAISKHFIENIGGNIKIESVFGEGSTFILKLPFNNSKCKERTQNKKTTISYIRKITRRICIFDNIFHFNSRINSALNSDYSFPSPKKQLT